LTDTESQELQGITLDVYLYVVKRGKPVGPRDVMKGSNLSSPSVAYRHLQKLEDIGYLKKDEFGEYQIAKKGRVRGYTWLGRRLLPKMWVYSMIFAVILAVEIFVLALHFEVETYEFKVFFLLLIIITGSALTVFTVEGYFVNKRKSGLKEQAFDA
jgi:hypothetical protein